MLRSILGRATRDRRRPAGGRPAPGTGTPGTGGGSANREIEQGAKSLIRGLSRKASPLTG